MSLKVEAKRPCAQTADREVSRYRCLGFEDTVACMAAAAAAAASKYTGRPGLAEMCCKCFVFSKEWV